MTSVAWGVASLVEGAGSDAGGSAVTGRRAGGASLLHGPNRGSQSLLGVAVWATLAALCGAFRRVMAEAAARVGRQRGRASAGVMAGSRITCRGRADRRTSRHVRGLARRNLAWAFGAAGPLGLFAMTCGKPPESSIATAGRAPELARGEIGRVLDARDGGRRRGLLRLTRSSSPPSHDYDLSPAEVRSARGVRAGQHPARSWAGSSPTACPTGAHFAARCSPPPARPSRCSAGPVASRAPSRSASLCARQRIARRA